MSVARVDVEILPFPSFHQIHEQELLWIFFGDIFQPQDSSRTDFRAESAAHTRGSRESLVRLRVLSDINPHLTVLGTHSARNAHVTLYADPVPSKFLYETEQRSHGAGKSTPDTCSTNGVKTDPHDPRQNRGHANAVK